MGNFFHIYGPDLTTYVSNFKSQDHPSSLNCQCDLVSHSSPTMDPFGHGDTVPLIFSYVYDIYSYISDAHEIFYRVMKVIHQIWEKIRSFIHDMATTLEAYVVESFNVHWEIVRRDIFSIIEYDSISEYACNEINSYNAPPSSNDDLQAASTHVLCLHHIHALMHDLSIHKIFTKLINNMLFIHLIQVKKRTR